MAPVESEGSTAEKTSELTQAPTPQESTPVEPAPVERRLHPMDPKYTADSVSTNAANVLATPSVRHFSRQKGVDLGKLAPGSGKGGRIEKKDIEEYLKNGSSSSTSTSVKSQGSTEQDVVVELGRTRYGMWKAMTKVRIPALCI